MKLNWLEILVVRRQIGEQFDHGLGQAIADVVEVVQ